MQVVTDIGSRPYQEDVAIATIFKHDKEWHLIGVLDGHNGGALAIDAKKLIVEKLDALTKTTKSADDMNLHLSTFLQDIDVELYKTYKDGKIGCAVALALYCVEWKKLWTVHLGDSRVLVIDIEYPRGNIIHATVDHKPQTEEKRITTAGGRVTRTGAEKSYRVDGDLAMSRALGDFHLKHCPYDKPDETKDKVLAIPAVTRVGITRPGSICIIAATDGLFDCLDNRDVSTTAKEYHDIERILNHAQAQFYQRDNITIVKHTLPAVNIKDAFKISDMVIKSAVAR
jgi:serine/threonine protein phosphatase PrpC